MKTDEHEIIAKYLGVRFDCRRLDSLAKNVQKGTSSYADCVEYLIQCKNVDVYLYLREGVLVGGHLHKYVDWPHSNHFLIGRYETDASRRELRAVEKILTELTQ